MRVRSIAVAAALSMAASGLTNHEAATLLNMSVHGVKFHLASIYRKLGVAHRTEAAVAYLQAYGPPESHTAS